MTIRRRIILVTLCVLAAAVAVTGCSRRGQTSEAPAQEKARAATTEAPPEDAVGPFYVGISSLDVGENERAGRLFETLSKEMSNEPAVWANLGLTRFRLGDLPGAEEALAVAAKMPPANARITVLQAIVDEYQGQFPRAIQRLRSLSDPDVAVLYRLAELLERTGPEADPREELRIYDDILKRQPRNMVAAFSRARLLARMENGALLADAIKDLDSYRANWSPAALQQFESSKTAVTSGNFRAAATDLAFLQNLSLATPAYQTGLAALGMSGGAIGEPLREFLKFHRPEVFVAAADGALKIAESPISPNGARPDICVALELTGKPQARLVTVANETLSIDGQTILSAPGMHGEIDRNSICAADLNGDGLQDIALINSNGLKIWLQKQDGSFAEYHPADAVRGAFDRPGHGVWAIDYDADGDLDILVARDGAPPEIFRNNGDGGFTAVDALALFPEIRDVCWGDFDGDGDDDLAVLDIQGRILVSWNERSGTFAAPQVISETSAVALTFGDVTGIGEMDLVVLDKSGAINNLSFDREKRAWTSRELARWSDPPNLGSAFVARRTSINLADMDNNGAPDVVASAGTASAIWLNEGRGKFQRLDNAPAMFVTSIADTDGDGFLDLVGLAKTGAAVARAQGTKGYHWQSIQARAQSIVGDGRINNCGIGGRIEIRAGPLAAVAPITSPRTHFGLGDHKEVGAARIVWPNGVAQVEFDLQPDQEVTANQRLKGSCPWVFARDADKFNFVKDFIWRSPLGMRINSQDTAGIDQTEDWILIPGKFLTADNGAYEIRITAELWETHFFDHIAMGVVDHPKGVATFIDERFVPTKPPKLEVIGTSVPQPFTEIRDQSGHDVSKALSANDGEYVADFALGKFQGVAEEHWVDFVLPDNAPAGRPLAVIGEGWIYPTDSSLNVAISQGAHLAPHGLLLEEFDPNSGWRTVGGDLGFPAGKNKTVVIPLPRESLQAGRRRFRLRTNLEVYWDSLGWAVLLPEGNFTSVPAKILSAELRYRGFSKLAPADRRKPDLPQYDKLAGTGPKWRDLEGYYTRYGDIRELLEKTDDRYVIMNAGDEMVLRFEAPAPPPAGWTRDFVLIGDGWVKDGDFNTANSRTVQPLPFHALQHYGGPSEPLEGDPVFQRNLEDWRKFQTRYVSPADFDRGFMVGARARADGGLR